MAHDSPTDSVVQSCSESGSDGQPDVEGLRRLADHVDAALGSKRALISDAVYHRAIEGLLDDEEWRKAAQTVTDWYEWMGEYKEEREFEERLSRLEEERGINEDN